jgi:hypothetical protein
LARRLHSESAQKETNLDFVDAMMAVSAASGGGTFQRVGMVAFSDEALVDQQRALQAEAADVLRDLTLLELVREVGDPVLVGSAALGLMVWRDLDLTVCCSTLDASAIVDIAARLALHPRIRQVVFRNDTGGWNTDPTYPDGLYIGLSYRSGDGNDWKSDIWFVDEPDRQPDLQHVRALPPRLTDESRLAVLRVKSVWATRPEYGREVGSFDIYTAVLDAGVRDPDGFSEWLVQRRNT